MARPPELTMDILASQDSNGQTTIEEQYEKCVALTSNLWWSWNADVQQIFRDLDPSRWRQLDHNPVALLREFTPERLDQRAAEMVLYSRINNAYRQLKEYMQRRPQWAANNAGVLGSRPVAYFSAEFGIHESLPIYSGGLGVLSGDHVKSASNLGIPLVAVGLFYVQGYFHQRLDAEGYQLEEYVENSVEQLPIQPATNPEGEPLIVSIDTRTGKILAKVWRMQVGRVRLYLLDCNVEGNSPQDRALSSRLYGGDMPHQDPPGVGVGHWRRSSADGTGIPPRRVPPQRRAQRLRAAGGHRQPHEDRRVVVR